MRRGVTIKQLVELCPWLSERGVRNWIAKGKLKPFGHPSGGRIVPLLLSRSKAMKLAQDNLERRQAFIAGPVSISVPALTAALKNCPLTQARMAAALDYSSRQGFVNRLTQIRRSGKMRTDELKRWAAVLRCAPEKLVPRAG